MLSLSNPFAAVPSVHTCFSLIIGLSCFFLVRRRPLGIAWLFYPALIIFSIVATGNHFWLDAILGAGVAVIAFADRLGDRAGPPDAAGARPAGACASTGRPRARGVTASHHLRRLLHAIARVV